MNAAENIEKLIKKFYMAKKSYVTTGYEMDKRVIDDAWAAYEKSKKTKSAQTQPNFWRIIMKKPITKFATAAVIMLVVVLSITFLDKAVAPAYAIEQTIQASHSIRYIHTKSFWPPHEVPMEAWIEFDATGTGRTFRIHMPAWTDPGGNDGDKVIVWKDNKAQIWLKKKNFYFVSKDNEIADMVFKSTEQFDPKMALQGLQLLKSEGKVDLDINLPEDKASPIIVTAAFLENATEEKPMTNTEREMAKLFNMWKGSENEISKLVLFVDQATKLVTSMEFYEQRQGQDHCAYILEYYDYNQPIAAEMFVLEDEIPPDAMRVNETTQEIGLLQGDLTDKEIAAEVVRQFFEALIARDYAKAGRLFGGVPAERIQKKYGHIRFIRIVSLGKPTLNPLTRELKVPYVVEIEENGIITEWKTKYNYIPVRQIHGQPGRWATTGAPLGI